MKFLLNSRIKKYLKTRLTMLSSIGPVKKLFFPLKVLVNILCLRKTAQPLRTRLFVKLSIGFSFLPLLNKTSSNFYISSVIIIYTVDFDIIVSIIFSSNNGPLIDSKEDGFFLRYSIICFSCPGY